MNKQEIEKRLAEIKPLIEHTEMMITVSKDQLQEYELNLSDYTLEESQLELQLAEIEEQEELTTYPSTDEKYGDFTGATEGDR